MEAQDRYFWDDEGCTSAECQTNPKTVGVSAVQFILTSSIVVHSLTMLHKVFINIFSCKDFNSDTVLALSMLWFKANRADHNTIVRR